MFSIGRTLEIFLFSLANFAPYVILSVYTFASQRRFSKAVTGFACTLLVLVQFFTRYWSALNNISLSLFMSILRLFIFLLIYAALFDVQFRKIVFIELIFANIGNFIIIAAVCLERNLFPDTNHQQYCWHCSIAMLILHLALTVPLTWLIRDYFKSMIANKFVGKEWNYYWIVPAIFYVIWQYQIHGGTETGLDIMTNPSNVIFLFIINIGSFLIYVIMIRLDSQLTLNLLLQEQNHYQDIALLEHRLLEERIEDARRARHDMRHHMMTMTSYLKDKDYDRLQEYMNTYHNSISEQPAIRFCAHPVINSILLHFAQQAQAQQIDFDVQLTLPEKMDIADMDISVLLGNLLENAIHACQDVPDEDRRVIVHGKGNEHSLFFTIDNTFANAVQKDHRGSFLSTKANGSGIGLASAKHIAEKYHGVFTTEAKDNMFFVSFMLNF